MARIQDGIDPRLVDGSWRVVVLKPVIESLKLKRGDHVVFVVEGSKVELREVKLSLD